MQHRLFKIALAIGLLFLLTVVFYPITFIGVMAKEGSWQYGFTFINPSTKMALFGAFSLALFISAYQVLMFERFRKIAPHNYLKVSPKHHYTGPIDKNILKERLAERNWKLIHEDDQTLQFKTKNKYFSPDTVTFSNVTATSCDINSHAFIKIIPVDGGRNYNNIIAALLAIKNIRPQ